MLWFASAPCALIRSFELRITNATVDLIAEGFDVAIRSVHLGINKSMFTVRRLGDVVGGFYAAPSYVARRGQATRSSRTTMPSRDRAARL